MKLTLTTFIFLILSAASLHAQDPFITTWKTDNPGTSNDDQITIPTDAGTYNYDVDWGDGSSDTGITGDITHTYTSAGTYTIEITGDFPGIHFNDSGDKDKILTIEQWGDIEWTSMTNAFFGASNLEINAMDAPDLSGVSTMLFTFTNATSLNSDLNNWDVSTITNMSSMFRGAESFNGDISNWDVSNVISMNGMFQFAHSFNQDISGWDVSNVTDMNTMFQNGIVDPVAFDQDLGNWDISNVTSMFNMLVNTSLSVANYDATLSGWASQSVQSGVSLGAAGLEYCAGADARQSLIDDHTWTIDGDALEAGCGPDPFITTWKTDNPGTSNDNQITITTDAGSTYNYDVDWGDGNSDTGVNGDATHTYDNPGTYTVEITGDFPRIYFNNSGDKDKIISIVQWGDIAWSSMDRAFRGATNLQSNATDTPDLSDVTDMNAMFAGATEFNQDIGDWDVSGVTDMRFMFANASSFNGDISSWEVSSVTTMREMFNGASAFDQNIDGWNVSNVIDMLAMFQNASTFDQDLNSWDVSNVVSMNGMFRAAAAFEGDISTWDVSNVTGMNGMFLDATVFNGDISGWNTGSVTNMTDMLRNANAFNRDLSDWDVSSVTGPFSMSGMLDFSGISVANYDATLVGWAGQTVQGGVDLGASGLEYCTGQTARQTLSNEFGWTITGDGPASGCDPSSVLLTGAPGFRMLSSPVEVSVSELLEPLWTQGMIGADYNGGDPNVWAWNSIAVGDDPSGWIQHTLSFTLPAGIGLLVWVFDEDEFGDPESAGFPKTLSVSGTVNSLPLMLAPNDNAGGWALRGNPVNTGIDWDDFTLNEVENTVYVWDPNTGASGDYVFWNGTAGDLTDGIIHPFQGFFVQTSAGASSPSIEIPADAATSPDDFFGKDQTEKPFVVRLQMEGEQGLGSTAWLQFSGEGSLTRNSTDAVKLQPLSADYAALALEPLSDDESSLLALKHLPLELETPLEIPLTATATREGEFTLTATDMTLPGGWSLSLRDTQTGEKVSVEQGMEYTFELDVEEAMEKSPDKLVGGGIPACGDAGVCPPPVTALTPQVLSKQKEDNSSTRFLLTITPAGGIEADLPDQITLEQNYPNPFNPATVISYQLPVSSDVRLEVYDMVGRQVATLVDGQVAAGVHQVNFDASRLSSGVYLYRLQTADAVFTKKLTLIK